MDVDPTLHQIILVKLCFSDLAVQVGQVQPAPHLQKPFPVRATGSDLVQEQGLQLQCSPQEHLLWPSSFSISSLMVVLHLHVASPGHGVGHPHLSLHTRLLPRTSAID